MDKKVIVIAPHPDDETLGCGGTLLRHAAEGDLIHWLIVTHMGVELGYSEAQVERRSLEIKRVSEKYGFSAIHELRFPTTRLDIIPMAEIVGQVSNVFKQVGPEIVYLPYRGDVHTDHRIVFDAAVACTKWFRYSSIRRILAYEAISETDFCIDPDINGFKPNVFVDVSNFLEQKIEIMKIFATEFGEFPFPRSEQAIRALANLRGAAAGFMAAEAFILLKEVL